MDARVAESAMKERSSWLERERVSGRLYNRAAILSGVFLIAMLREFYTPWLDRAAA